MRGFLAKSACNGRRPSHLAARRHYARPNLIARLLRERHVVRFLVAPEGFGKSGLCMEYAETVFSFDHTFWINGKSPCFLRDLDRGVLAEYLLAFDSQPFLVIIDDIPLLEASRSEQLSAEFDELLNHECEVLVTCTPMCDAFSSLQSDRARMNAFDLLLSDAEVDLLRTLDDRAANPAPTVPACKRVASLCWSPSGGDASFLSGVMNEEMPAEVLLEVATMLVLEKGFLSDVAAFGSCGADVAQYLTNDYPHLGIDQRTERFEAPSFSIERLTQTMVGKIDAIAICSRFSDRDTLVVRWADLLVSRMQGERACALVQALASRSGRAEWLARQSDTLLKQGTMVPAHKIYESLGSSNFGFQSSLEIGAVLRLLALGNKDSAFAQARRVMADIEASQGARALAGLVMLRYGSSSVRAKVLKELEYLLNSDSASMLSPGFCFSSFDREELFWRPLARGCVELACNATWFEQGSLEECFDTANEDARILLAAEILREYADAKEAKSDKAASQPPFVAKVESYVRKRLAAMAASSGDLYVGVAGLMFQHAREKGVLADARPLGARETLALHRVEMDLFSQRRAFDVRAREKKELRAEQVLTRPDAYLDGRYLPESTTLPSMVPMLTVNMFGGMSVRIGDTPVDRKRLSRRKVKTLLALLVLNRGREISRDKILNMMWPDSTFNTARKSFYSVWSQLRAALTDSSGSCPYLVRHQGGCSLDERLLVTDVARFDAVCRMLLFGQPDSQGWSRLYTEVDEVFSDDLLPIELKNDLLDQARREYRMKLVDALVAAANRLVALGDAQEGLWFARAALRRDHTREDAYMALIQAQIAADQRTAALETYFSCRQVLTNELGIDPSVKIVALYRSIIETEELLT